jgi:phenylpyruvate tautomerase PptA (4-oxalocrotonate tautomerase family)
VGGASCVNTATSSGIPLGICCLGAMALRDMESPAGVFPASRVTRVRPPGVHFVAPPLPARVQSDPPQSTVSGAREQLCAALTDALKMVLTAPPQSTVSGAREQLCAALTDALKMVLTAPPQSTVSGAREQLCAALTDAHAHGRGRCTQDGTDSSYTACRLPWAGRLS